MSIKLLHHKAVFPFRDLPISLQNASFVLFPCLPRRHWLNICRFLTVMKKSLVEIVLFVIVYLHTVLNFKPFTVHASSNILMHLTIRHPYSLHCLKFQHGNKWLPWQTSPTIPAVVDGTLKIMTYNVWFGAMRLKERCTAIVGIIKKSGAQVVAMQEVFI